MLKKKKAKIFSAKLRAVRTNLNFLNFSTTEQWSRLYQNDFRHVNYIAYFIQIDYQFVANLLQYHDCIQFVRRICSRIFYIDTVFNL